MSWDEDIMQWQPLAIFKGLSKMTLDLDETRKSFETFISETEKSAEQQVFQHFSFKYAHINYPSVGEYFEAFEN